MRRFVKNILIFAIVLLSILGIQFAFLYYQKQGEEVKITNKNIIIGDSNTRWSMDDKIIKGYSNFSTGGELYLFAHTKLKILTKHNKIDTLVLSFSPHNIINSMWWDDSVGSPIGNRMANYYQDYTLENHLDLLCGLPKNYLKSLTKIGKVSVSSYFNFVNKNKKENKLFRFGSYIPSIQNETEFERVPYIYKKPEITPQEIKYLQKIIEFCKENKIKLILIQTPKNYLREDYSNYDHKEFYEYYDNHLSGIDFLDFSKLQLPKNAYWDITHVDIVGAEYFSHFIQNKGFSKLLKSEFNRKTL